MQRLLAKRKRILCWSFRGILFLLVWMFFDGEVDGEVVKPADSAGWQQIT